MVVSGDSYVTLNKYRTSVQIAVQLISASFDFLQQSVICHLFNHAGRDSGRHRQHWMPSMPGTAFPPHVQPGAFESRMLGSLMASAASATTVDGGIRQHSKFDNTRYTYNGRSCGVGASLGLADGDVTDNLLALSYVYQENGLRAEVECIYNSSTEFVIAGEPDPNIYPVAGNLPDSSGGEEYSENCGHGSDAIVAIGVAVNNASTSGYLGSQLAPVMRP